MAFAIEVFLKSLCMKRELKQVLKQTAPTTFEISDEESYCETAPPKGGHDVGKVFKNLPQNVRERLQAQYLDQTGRSLLEDLLEIGPLFASLRYLHELHNFTYQPHQIEEIAKFLCEQIESDKWYSQQIGIDAR
ncbi:hypothetical protein [Celeribacter sp. PS-C1]|uniref:hypothetical protein n=1 Tax=Celeribacter sp. PS-C1 TaxID=2820813 RepID=UPI001CA5360E|nr:hypothetical protein [Celeribacter sp. PS-C1]MBW6418697.1 hypothetical protein [Celeribacter sp. PS-C1]